MADDITRYDPTDDNDKPVFTDALAAAFAALRAKLKTVALSGSYNDLTDTPNLSAVATSGAYSDLSGTPNLATVATSGAYSDLSGTPNLASVATSGSYNDLTDIPTPLTTSEATDMVNSIFA